MSSTPLQNDSGLLFKQSRVIVVLDIVDSVRLMEADESGTVLRWRKVMDRLVLEKLPQGNGRLVKSLGDGVLLEFGNARFATEVVFWAFRVAQQDAAGPVGQEIRLRAAMHSTDFYVDEYDIYGRGVNAAARLAAIAGESRLLASASVCAMLTPGLDADFADLGLRRLKGISEPMRVFLLSPPGQGVAGGTAIASSTHDLRPVVAVVNLTPRNADGDHRFLGLALADEISSALSRCWDLRVTSRLSSGMEIGATHGASNPGRLLNADFVVGGAFTVQGNVAQFVIELADTSSGETVWSDSRRCSLDDLVGLQEEIGVHVSQRVCAAIAKVALSQSRLSPWKELNGYAMLRQSIQSMYSLEREDFMKAGEMLAYVNERWYDMAITHACRAQWHVLRLAHGWSPDPSGDAAFGRELADRSIELDDQNALALAIAGNVRSYLQQDFSEAHRLYDAALHVNPSEPIANALKGAVLAWEDRIEEALVHADRALRVAPFDPTRYYLLTLAATAQVSAGDYAKAIALSHKALSLNAMHVPAYKGLLLALALGGQTADARKVATTLLQTEQDFTIRKFRERSPAARSRRLPDYLRALREAGIPD